MATLAKVLRIGIALYFGLWALGYVIDWIDPTPNRITTLITVSKGAGTSLVVEEEGLEQSEYRVYYDRSAGPFASMERKMLSSTLASGIGFRRVDKNTIELVSATDQDTIVLERFRFTQPYPQVERLIH